MKNPPKELIKQIEIITEVINNLDLLINPRKIKVEYYSKDFVEPLTEIRTEAFELRNNLDVFKTKLERSLTDQYYVSDRFASTKMAKKVLKEFLEKDLN